MQDFNGYWTQDLWMRVRSKLEHEEEVGIFAVAV
jgi:hypothetical protein